MEAFSLLKYWRGGSDGVNGDSEGCKNVRATSGKTTIVTSVAQNAAETECDDGPFYDLEFAVPDEEDIEGVEEGENSEANGGNESDGVEIGDDSDGEERDFNFILSSGSSNDRFDSNLSFSPSDDLFFKGRLLPIEPNSKPSQFSSSLLKSATKFRVFTMGLKKSRSSCGEKTGEKTESNGSVVSASEQQEGLQTKKPQKQQEQQQDRKQSSGKFFTVKLKVEEVPIISLFTRDNNSRASSRNKSQKQSTDKAESERRFSKEAMQKYLKMVKPLYIRASRKYGEKLKFSGQLNLNGLLTKAATMPSTTTQKSKPTMSSTEKNQIEPEVSSASQSNLKTQKQGNLQARFRVVCKHLGKSRSASSAVAASPAVTVSSRRHDDSLQQQQDGIQSAILHCKRSLNDCCDWESSVLLQSDSDPTIEKTTESSRKSENDNKDRTCDQSL